MTIAIIVACKDSVYIVSDTLTIDEESKICSLNTKKFFYSEKHKIVMCLSGMAVLQPKDIQVNEEHRAMYVDFLVSEFFSYIDSQPLIEINNFNNILIDFLSTNYFNYADILQDQVEYFYGGFENNKDPVIYSCIKGEINKACYAEENYSKYYTNSPKAIEQCINITLGLDVVQQDLTSDKLLNSPENLPFLTFTVPYACGVLNKNYGFKYIGNYLQYVRINYTGKLFKKTITYNLSDEYELNCEIDSVNFPELKIYKSFLESNQAFFTGELKKYLPDGSAIPIDKPENITVGSMEICKKITNQRYDLLNSYKENLLLEELAGLYNIANIKYNTKENLNSDFNKTNNLDPKIKPYHIMYANLLNKTFKIEQIISKYQNETAKQIINRNNISL